MDSKGIFEALQAKFGDGIVFGFNDAAVKGHDPFFFVQPERVVDVATHLRDSPQIACDYLECLSGVDYPDTPAMMPGPDKDGGSGAYRSPPAEEGEEEKGSIQVVYHLFSYAKKHRVVVKASLPRNAPKLPTVSTVWSAANWQERECYDLLGVEFEGHPNLRRIMLPDDWIGHPLRKDYKEQPEYHGIPTTRPDPLELLTIKKPVPAKPAAKADAAKKPAPKKADEKGEPDKKPAPKKADEKGEPDKPVADKKDDADKS